MPLFSFDAIEQRNISTSATATNDWNDVDFNASMLPLYSVRISYMQQVCVTDDLSGNKGNKAHFQPEMINASVLREWNGYFSNRFDACDPKFPSAKKQ